MIYYYHTGILQLYNVPVTHSYSTEQILFNIPIKLFTINNVKKCNVTYLLPEKGGVVYMPAKKRIWYPGAIYHIISRGNRKSDIFRAWEDYHTYLFYLKGALKFYNCFLHSYCLMTNHVHLQIETSNKELGLLMREINRNYAKYFNGKYDLVGHLFQSRYKAEIIEDDDYILRASSYIHLNPLNARMVKNAEDYKWSSYSTYIGESECDFITTDKVLGYFKENNKQLYKEYVESQIPIIEEDKGEHF